MNIDLLSIFIVRTLHCLGCYCATIGIISLIAMIASIAYWAMNMDSSGYSYNSERENEYKNRANLGAKFSKKLCITAIITLAVAFFTPSETEYYAFASYKVAEAASNTNLGTKSQEFINQWLEDKLIELQKSNKKNNDN